MPVKKIDTQKEIDTILAAAQIGISLGAKDLEHLSNSAGIANYIRLAGKVAKWLKSGKILDWGCGYGQMMYLLKNRGFEVLGYDVGGRKMAKKIPLFAKLKAEYGQDDVKISLPSDSFDAILSCGTLEHVKDDRASLAELSRVLKKGGFLFIFMLPNKYSLVEGINTLRGTSDHPRKYTLSGIKKLLKKSGFRVIHTARGNMLPKNLTGFPKPAKKIYGKFGRLVSSIDFVLSNIPAINQISGVLEIIAVKKK